MRTLVAILSLLPFVSLAQSDKALNERYEMKQYYLVILKEGPNRNQDSVTTARIMKEHLAYLTKMYDEKKIDLCGPILEEGEMAGIAVYNVANAGEAKSLAEQDPGVKSGRLKVEVHPWYSAKGFCTR